eukprot:7013816-Karenia_brevis.AAC.1
MWIDTGTQGRPTTEPLYIAAPSFIPSVRPFDPGPFQPPEGGPEDRQVVFPPPEPPSHEPGAVGIEMEPVDRTGEDEQMGVPAEADLDTLGT